jgi:hypothetical protein
MGADIRLFVERRDASGAWQALDPAQVGRPYRNYHVFNRLAGVRQETVRERGDMSEPIAEPRGLPDGSTFKPDDDDDSYSHSWLLVSELVDLPGAHVMRDLLDTLGTIAPLEPTDRLVFWFD